MINTPGTLRATLFAFIFFVVPSCFILLSASGCQAVGAIAHAIPQYQDAAYSGLAGQSAGVMVWADRGVRVDWSSINLDLSNTVQQLLRKTDAKELKETRWPVQPASIVRYQLDHPGYEAIPVAEIAPKLGVTRLIYIEIESFSTRSPASLELYRGNATATLKVVEIANGHGKVAFEESGITAFFPKKSGPEGVLNSSDEVMYRGTVAVLAQKIADRLTTHLVDDSLGG